MPISRGSTTWFDKELHNRSNKLKEVKVRRAAGCLKQGRETYEMEEAGRRIEAPAKHCVLSKQRLHAVDDSDCRSCQRQPDCSNVDGPQGSYR